MGYLPNESTTTDKVLWWLEANEYESSHGFEGLASVFGVKVSEMTACLTALEGAGEVWSLKLSFRAGLEPFQVYFSKGRCWRLVLDGSRIKSKHRFNRESPWIPRHSQPAFKLMVDGDVLGRVFWLCDGSAQRWEISEPARLKGHRAHTLDDACRDIRSGVNSRGQTSLFGAIA